MLSTKDMLVLGMMVFALFLGAGNIIFPPMAGFQSGNQWFSTSLGFLVTGVLLPFLTLVTVAIRGRGERLSIDLPSWFAVLFWIALYLIVGSTFAMPRVTNTAYEMGFLPLGLIEKNTTTHLTFALIFNLLSMFFMLKQGTMISAIGKFMTPALLILLVVVGIAVVAKPLSPIEEPTAAYLDMFKGLDFIAIVSLLAWGLGYFGQPHILARFMAADSNQTIRKARRIGMTWMILCLGGTVAVGFFGIAYFEVNPRRYFLVPLILMHGEGRLAPH